jgi:high-affinity Fe2+/Pb2+ permease
MMIEGVIALVALAVLCFYAAWRLDNYEHNQTRDERRAQMRAQAQDEMDRINYLYPSLI